MPQLVFDDVCNDTDITIYINYSHTGAVDITIEEDFGKDTHNKVSMILSEENRELLKQHL